MRFTCKPKIYRLVNNVTAQLAAQGSVGGRKEITFRTWALTGVHR